MAWTTPMTAIAGEIWHASEFNTHVRDNLLETMPAKATMGYTVYDDFDRTETDGWGTADSGETWTHTNGSLSDYSVSSGLAEISVNVTDVRHFSLIPYSTDDVDITSLMTIDTPLDDLVAPLLAARYTDDDNYYELLVLVSTDGSVTLNLIKFVAGAGTIIGDVPLSNVEHDINNVYGARLRIIDERLSGKIWLASEQSEPIAWSIEASDSDLTTGTHAGVGATLAASQTTPCNFSFEHVYIEPHRRIFTTSAVNEITETQPSTLDITSGGAKGTDVAFNPCCVLTKTTSVLIPSGGDHVIDGWSPVRNDSVSGTAMFDAANDDRITIQAAGEYALGFNGRFQNASGRRNLYIFVNGVDINVADHYFATAFPDVNTNWGTAKYISARFELEVGDIIRAGVFQNSGSDLSFLAASPRPNVFYVRYIRPLFT